MDTDSENEDPDDLDVIENLLHRLPDSESEINDFLTRSLAIFMLLRWVMTLSWIDFDN